MAKRKVDPFYQHRQTLKGVFVATKPKGRKVLAKALDYKTLWEQIKAKKLNEEKLSIKYLEPKGAICATPFLLGRVGFIDRFDMHLLASERKLVFEEV